jgi:sulfur carrier protein
MRVVVNGESRELPEDASVAHAVSVAGAAEIERGIAVAVEGEVVPRAEWEGRILAEGESVEVVHAVQGG